MSRRRPPKFELNAFSVPFRAESDRACAVLGAALLDSLLEGLYERRLQSHKTELLSNNGALATFSARIRLAAALAWISDDARFDLDQVRAIRNEFAHNFDHDLSFSNQSIADKCRTLKVANTLIEANEYASSVPHRNLSASVIRAMGAVFEPPRQRFEVTVEMLAQYLEALSAESPQYSGPNLKEELWALGSRVEIKISATGTVTSRPKDDESP